MKQMMYRDCEITIVNNGDDAFPWEGHFVVKVIPYGMRFILDRDQHHLGTSVQTEKQCIQLLRGAVDAYLADKERIRSRAGKYWHDVGYERGGVQVIVDFQDVLEDLLFVAMESKALPEEKCEEIAKRFNLEWNDIS